MIYYFSGTGNSQWVANQLANATGDQARNIIEWLNETPLQEEMQELERIGIVFPIYAWGAPAPVISFLKSLKVSDAAYRYAICTCGDEAGYAMERLKRSFPIQSAWSLIMPNNYIIMYDVDSSEEEMKKVNAAKILLSKIGEEIKNKKTVWEVKHGVLPFIKSYLIQPLFARYACSPDKFTVESKCTSCGLCENLCPMKTIAMKDGRPQWTGDCLQCLACIHHCPVQAIQYGKQTQNKGRYVFGRRS
jgi:ferredoxin